VLAIVHAASTGILWRPVRYLSRKILETGTENDFPETQFRSTDPKAGTTL
jgi:hypothetical protein